MARGRAERERNDDVVDGLVARNSETYTFFTKIMFLAVSQFRPYFYTKLPQKPISLNAASKFDLKTPAPPFAKNGKSKEGVPNSQDSVAQLGRWVRAMDVVWYDSAQLLALGKTLTCGTTPNFSLCGRICPG